MCFMSVWYHMGESLCDCWCYRGCLFIIRPLGKVLCPIGTSNYYTSMISADITLEIIFLNFYNNSNAQCILVLENHKSVKTVSLGDFVTKCNQMNGAWWFKTRLQMVLPMQHQHNQETLSVTFNSHTYHRSFHLYLGQLGGLQA